MTDSTSLTERRQAVWDDAFRIREPLQFRDAVLAAARAETSSAGPLLLTRDHDLSCVTVTYPDHTVLRHIDAYRMIRALVPMISSRLNARDSFQPYVGDGRLAGDPERNEPDLLVTWINHDGQCRIEFRLASPSIASTIPSLSAMPKSAPLTAAVSPA